MGGNWLIYEYETELFRNNIFHIEKVSIKQYGLLAYLWFYVVSSKYMGP